MDEATRQAEQFEANRVHLRAVAYRMLGSLHEADDAVQEAWLRLNRSDTSDVVNLSGWLTTVVARVCLDMLRSRKSRREEPLGDLLPEPKRDDDQETDAEDETIIADSVGLALLVVLETLAPAERVAFVLHDIFDLPFAEIAPIVGRTSTAARQLASRARRRVQGAETTPEPDLTRQLASRARRRVQGAETTPEPDLTRQREVVDAFLAASRGGDFLALLSLLDPDVVLRADAVAVQLGATAEVRGATAVSETFAGRARVAQPALINGAVGLVWAPGGQPKVVFGLTIVGEKIAGIELIADAERIGQLKLTILGE